MGLGALLLLARAGAAAAFPLLDVENTDGVPQGIELAAPDAQGLQHQLQLANGLSAPAGGGWTFAPRLSWQEALTDNVLQAHSPRYADLVSFFSPGIGVAGDLPRLKMTFDIAPILSIYARTGDLNSLTEEMTGLANVTVVPDLAFVDVRAISGVQSIYGGIGGIGAGGSSGGINGGGGIGAGGGTGVTGTGLNKNNAVQLTSAGVTPYLLRRFGDWGTGRLGYSLNMAQSTPLSGFAASPIPIGDGNGTQTVITNEESAHFVTGDILRFVQDTFDIDLQQTRITTGAGAINARTGLPAQANREATSSRAIVTDQISYMINRGIEVFVSGGHESIQYSGIGAPSINDLTWSFGTTLMPDPDSQMTVSYGHLNGANSLSADGHYALTARTMVSVSYGSTLGTQLQNVQNQLNLATANGRGGLVNGQTGGQLFGANNALGVQDGIFRTTTLTVGTQTTLDRDIFSINLLMAEQTSANSINTSTANSKTINLNWVHQMRPDMMASAAFSYALQDQSTGTISAANPGNNTTVWASLALQWQMSDTANASVRYFFLDRQTPIVTYQVLQNMLILGISKTF